MNPIFQQKGIGYGFGKTILFGEHFVVYGLPGIVAALGHQGEVIVEKCEGETYLTDNSQKFPGVQQFSWQTSGPLIAAVLDHLNITTPLHITVGGDLPVPHSGIGSSAAHLVALSRALNNAFDLNLTDEQINQAAFEGERVIHGNPSGIDNTAATYGGVFWYEKSLGIKPIKVPSLIEIVLIESGQETETKKVIEAVRVFKENSPALVDEIFEEYKKIIAKGRRALEKGDLSELGNLMNENHALLQKLTVSCDALDDVVARARQAGALGAKLTGTGRGGLAVALTPGKELQDRVAHELEQAGYAVLKTMIAQSPPPAPENFAAKP